MNLKNQVSHWKKDDNKTQKALNETSFEKLYPIIEAISVENQITIQQVMKVLNKSRTTAWRYMKILVEAGIVESDGSTNNIVYRLKV